MKSKDGSKKHYTEISVAKGILITLVVIGHTDVCTELVNFIYLMHMPCFFFISGFLFNERYLTGIKGFIVKKIKGLYIPFVKWSLIFLCLHNLFYRLKLYKVEYGIEDFALRLFKIFTLTGSEQLLGGFWFLKELLYASVIAILSMKLITMLKKRLDNKTLISLSLLFTVLAYLASIAPFKIPTIGSKTLLATAYFIAGYAFKSINFENSRTLLTGIAGILLTIITSFFFNENTDVMGIALFKYFAISVIASISTIYISKSIKGRAMHIMDYVGKYTLEILTFHFISFKMVSLLVIAFCGLPIKQLADFPVIYTGNDFLWIGYTLAGVALPIIIGRAIDKMTANKKGSL